MELEREIWAAIGRQEILKFRLRKAAREGCCRAPKLVLSAALLGEFGNYLELVQPDRRTPEWALVHDCYRNLGREAGLVLALILAGDCEAAATELKLGGRLFDAAAWLTHSALAWLEAEKIALSAG